MYPVLKIMRMLNFLDTFSMGVTRVILNTFILPNRKPNRFTYHVSHQGTSRHKFKLRIYQTSKHLGQNLIFASRVISRHSCY